MIFILKEYTLYLFRCLFSPNRSVKSKQLNLIRDALKQVSKSNTNFRIAEQQRIIFKKNNSEIEISDFGAGSRVFNTNKRKISDLVRYASLSRKYGRLLANISSSFNINIALELGTSLGLTSLYLAHSKNKIIIETVEACSNTAEIAIDSFRETNSNNINLHLENFDTFLASAKLKTNTGLVYIDGNHSYGASIKYFNILCEKLSDNSILIFDDIRHSKEMLRAWNKICNSSKSYLCIDLFRLGIVFLNPKTPSKLIYLFH